MKNPKYMFVAMTILYEAKNINGKMTLRTQLVAAFHTLGSRGRNIQATRCVLGGKSRVKTVTLLLTHPFRLTPNKSKGDRAY